MIKLTEQISHFIKKNYWTFEIENFWYHYIFFLNEKKFTVYLFILLSPWSISIIKLCGVEWIF